jgi:hypothetical protein
MRYELRKEEEAERWRRGIYTPPDNEADADQLMSEKPWLIPQRGLCGKPVDDSWY